jgi:hypothetical protein
VVEVGIMELGSLLFTTAFAAIVIGPLAGLLVGLITTASRGVRKPPTLKERPS